MVISLDNIEFIFPVPRKQQQNNKKSPENEWAGWAAHSYWHHPSWKILSISESLFLDSSLYVGRHRTGRQNRYCGEEEDTAFVLALNFGQTRPLAWLLFISFRTPRRDTPQRRNWNICASDSCICARNNCLLFVHLLETLALSYEQQYSYLFNK